MTEAFTTVTRKIFCTNFSATWIDECQHNRLKQRKETTLEVALLTGVVADKDTFDAHAELGGMLAVFRDGALLTHGEPGGFPELWKILARDDDVLVVVQSVETIWRATDGTPNPLGDKRFA